jgi:hypothetical protein
MSMTLRELFRKNSGWGQERLSDLYDTVHMALWSLVIASAIFFCMFALPRMPQLRADFQAKRILELQAENRSYCEKWGFAHGTQKHAACIIDLEELRAKIDQRASAEEFP